MEFMLVIVATSSSSSSSSNGSILSSFYHAGEELRVVGKVAVVFPDLMYYNLDRPHTFDSALSTNRHSFDAFII